MEPLSFRAPAELSEKLDEEINMLKANDPNLNRSKRLWQILQKHFAPSPDPKPIPENTEEVEKLKRKIEIMYKVSGQLGGITRKEMDKYIDKYL